MVRLMAPREPEATGIQVLRLGPPRVLGTFHDAVSWSRDNMRRWIDRGQADAEALIQSAQFSLIAAGAGHFV